MQSTTRWCLNEAVSHKPGREGPSRPHLSGTGVAGFVIMRSAYWRLRLQS